MSRNKKYPTTIETRHLSMGRLTRLPANSGQQQGGSAQAGSTSQQGQSSGQGNQSSSNKQE